MKRYGSLSNRICCMLCCYWFPLTIGFIISGILVIVELDVRGRFVIGGEWFFPICFCIIHYFIRENIKARKRRKIRHKLDFSGNIALK